MSNDPNWRMPVGIFVILALIVLLAVGVAAFSPWIGTLHALLQTMIYVTAGLVWVAPLKPLLQWMETGQFSRGKPRE